METFQNGRWRDTARIGHRRGALHGMDRGTFKHHVPNLNPPPLMEKSWQRSSNIERGDCWGAGDEHFRLTNSHLPSTFTDDFQKHQENGYGNQWTAGDSGITNGPTGMDPRMELNTRGNSWRGRHNMRSDDGPRPHHNSPFTNPPFPHPHPHFQTHLNPHPHINIHPHSNPHPHTHPHPHAISPPAHINPHSHTHSNTHSHTGPYLPPLFRGQSLPHGQHRPLLHSPVYNTPPDLSSPTSQDSRTLEGPLTSFPSPSSTESEGSPLPRDAHPRDPRQRSYHSFPASPLYNYQEKKLSPSLEHPSSPHNSQNISHSFDPRSSNSQYHEVNYIHNQSSNHGHHYSGVHGSEPSRRGRLSGVNGREGFHFSPRPPVIKENTNRGFPRTREKDDQLVIAKNQRLLVEHCYFNRSSNTENSPKSLFNSRGRGSSVLRPCKVAPIPLFTYIRKQTSDKGISNLVTTHLDAKKTFSSPAVATEESCLINEDPDCRRNADNESDEKTSVPISPCVNSQAPETKSDPSLERRTGSSSPNSRNVSMLETKESFSFESRSDSTPWLEEESLTQTWKGTFPSLVEEESSETAVQKGPAEDLGRKKKEVSVSPLSLLGFEIDLDTEMESSASSSPNVSSDDEAALPLFVSFPLSKVTLPTKVIIKSSLITKAHLPPVRQQQTDTMQLRNRALPRNLSLYASRKTPVKVISAKEMPIDSDEVSIEKVENRRPFVKIGHVYGDDGNASPQSEVNSIELSDGGEEISAKSDSEEDRDSLESLRLKAGNKRKNESSSTELPFKRTRRKLTPEVSSQPQLQHRRVTRQQQKFQDFVPVVLRSRSRTETKTIQRRQKMAIEMQKHEKERKDTARPCEKEVEEEEEVVPYRTRRRTRRRDKSSPTQSLDDTSSIISESVSSKDQENSSTMNSDEFSPELIRRCKFVVQSRDRSGSGDSPLHHVCRKGKYDMLRYFLSKENYSINIQDNAGWTPLHEACNNGHKDIVELLLQRGADPNLPARDGTRPIHDAVDAGNFSIVSILVQNGADPLVEYSERTPLELAKSAGHLEIAAFLSEVCEKRRLMLSKEQPTQTASANTCSRPVSKTASDHVMLPVDGYSEPLLGPELDQPILYISATIEMSSKPMLPVYNIIMSSGSNPRKHNFHILSDVLDLLDTTKQDLLDHLNVTTYSIPVEEFIDQMKERQITKNTKILQRLKPLEKGTKLELLPLCEGLRELMDIVIENIDD